MITFCATALTVHTSMAYMNYRCLPSGLKHFSGTSCDILSFNSDPNDKSVLKQTPQEHSPFHKLTSGGLSNSLVSRRGACRLSSAPS